MSDITLAEAIGICEAFGFAVIDEERIKKLSFHIITTDSEKREFAGDIEYLEKRNEEKAIKSILNELVQRKYIEVSEHTEEIFPRNATRKSWKLKVII